MAGESNTVILIILAIFFPPAPVAFLSGCGADLCINILLTLLAYLPGFIHALWLVMRRTDANERYGYKNWTYAGMGEYAPRGGAPSSGPQTASYNQPATSASSQGAASGAVPPPIQAPAGQQPGGYVPPPPPAPPGVGYSYQALPQAPVDQKVIVDQKQSEYQTPAPVPGDQKVAADQQQGEYQAPAQAQAAAQQAINVTPVAPSADQK